MHSGQVLTIAVALCCIAALGLAGGSLGETVETDPDSVIDVHSRWLPVGDDTVRSLDRRVKSAAGGSPGKTGSGEQTATKAGEGDEVGEARVPQETDGSAETEVTRERSAPAPASAEAPASAAAPQDRNRNKQSAGGSDSSESDEKQSDQQRSPLETLLLAVAALALLAVALLAVRYRDRILALLRDRFGSPDEGEPDDAPLRPRNVVTGAWAEMVLRLDGDRPDPARTAREYAAAAVEAGYDPEAVRQLTRTFEEVRYGNATVTEERKRRVHESIRTVRARGTGEGR